MSCEGVYESQTRYSVPGRMMSSSIWLAVMLEMEGSRAQGRRRRDSWVEMLGGLGGARMLEREERGGEVGWVGEADC